MDVRRLVYKVLNLFCFADITRVLLLNTDDHRLKPFFNTEVGSHWISDRALNELANDDTFSITNRFVDDFQTMGFRAVAATIDDQVIGLLFLASGSVAGRHNSGGSHFRGIELSLPEGVNYLFKVIVKPEYRGRRVNPAMIAFAAEQLALEGLTTIVTTTDWTNNAFLRSAELTGFRRCGFASEFVLLGRHYYQLPGTLYPPNHGEQSKVDSNFAIQFRGGG